MTFTARTTAVGLGGWPGSATALWPLANCNRPNALVISTRPSIRFNVVVSLSATAILNSVPLMTAYALGVSTGKTPGLSRWKKKRMPRSKCSPPPRLGLRICIVENSPRRKRLRSESSRTARPPSSVRTRSPGACTWLVEAAFHVTSPAGDASTRPSNSRIIAGTGDSPARASFPIAPPARKMSIAMAELPGDSFWTAPARWPSI